MGDAEVEVQDVLFRFGRNIGIAFQVQYSHWLLFVALSSK